MARRLQTVIYDIDPDPTIESLHLGAALDAGADRDCLHIPHQLSRQIARTHRYQLRALDGGGWTPNVSSQVRQAAQGGYLVAEWAAIELFFDEPAGTTVTMRLHDGAGASWWWDGGAWALAGATDYNVAADIIANFATFAATDATLLGVEWLLITTDKTATPFVYGALIGSRLMFASRSGKLGTTVSRSDGWLDDVIHRVLLPYLQSNILPEVTDEREAQDELKVLDYSKGVGDGETNYVVSDVQAVYNLDVDPAMLSPLSGTWDPVDKCYTLDIALADCTLYAARLVYIPLVAYSGKADFFDSTLPQVLIEEITEKNDIGTHGQVLVRDKANLQALGVPYPRLRQLKLVALLQGDDHINTWELAESISRITGGTGGVVLVSAGTGMPVSVRAHKQLRPARGDQTIEIAARFDLTVWSREYLGTEQTVPLMKEGGFLTTIVPAETVVAR